MRAIRTRPNSQAWIAIVVAMFAAVLIAHFVLGLPSGTP